MVYADTYPRRAPAEVFWGEMTPVEHAVQIYADASVLLDSLEGFASGGFRAGDGVLIIGTAAHRAALERRLRARGYDVDRACAENRYVPVDADAALAQFMVDGWPDEGRFKQLAGGLIQQARGAGRPVRAFGEMVAILWDQGLKDAAVRLEQLWNKLGEEKEFCLFCAYPRSAFTHADHDAILEICAHHSRVLPE